MKSIRAPPRAWVIFDRIFVAYLFGFGLDFWIYCGMIVVKKNSKKEYLGKQAL